MQGNLINFVRLDPLQNIQKIWTEYLPNDPFCQQHVKEGRDHMISTATRCDDCRAMNTNANIFMYNGITCHAKHHKNSKPKFKYYGSMEGRLKRLLQQVGDIYLLCCPESETAHHYIGIDDHTNQIISNVMLEEIIPNNVISMERIYRCQDRITIIQEVHYDDLSHHMKSIDVYFQQIQEIVSKLSSVRFHLGCITKRSLIIGDKGVMLNTPRDASFDINDEYRIGPILDDYSVPHLDVFSIVRYPEKVKRHYFRMPSIVDDEIAIQIVSKYGIPVVGRALDMYRLTCCMILKFLQADINYNFSSTLWFQRMFLASEHQRVAKRIRAIAYYFQQNEATENTLDIVHCLFDKEGPFALRCDTHQI